MLEIHYGSKRDHESGVKTYEKASDFVSATYLEVPPLPDYYYVTKAVLDGHTIDLKDDTVKGLFDYLSKGE
ncbi:MAG: hypothetical protein ACK5LL_16970 [Suipraeoptans sp.]